MKVLEEFLQLTLKDFSLQAKKFLKQRGITREVCNDWQIGYLPEDISGVENFHNDIRILKEQKILMQNGTHYFSPLCNYITFPMYDQYNELIAFSGRRIKEGKERKYFHSSFDKKHFLFGLNKAKQSILQKNYVIIGEGQFDTITAHANGITNTVSTSGTALCADQIAILSRYCDRIVLVYDNDEAGRRSTEKAIQNYSKCDIELYPIIIPQAGEDIDSYIRNYGRESFQTLIDKKINTSIKSFESDIIAQLNKSSAS